MDGLQLRDEAVRDRIRAAEEFLDPSMLSAIDLSHLADLVQMTRELGGEQEQSGS